MKNVKYLPKVRDGRQRRATQRGARHKINPPGTKVGCAAAKSLGQDISISRPVFHGGELTAAHGKKLVNYKDRDEKRVVITKGEKWSVTRG